MYNYNTAVARKFCGIILAKSRTKRNKYHCCVFCFMCQSLGGCCVQEKTFTATQKCHFVYQYGVEAETKRPQSDCLPLFIRRKSESRFHRFCYDNIITAVQVVIGYHQAITRYTRSLILHSFGFRSFSLLKHCDGIKNVDYV